MIKNADQSVSVSDLAGGGVNQTTSSCEGSEEWDSKSVAPHSRESGGSKFDPSLMRKRRPPVGGSVRGIRSCSQVRETKISDWRFGI